jgi:radical SAM protein with 4Fe4S-binding SPASM domain
MVDVDNHKLMLHPERVAEWKEKGDCYPIYVEIGPTNSCNHRCGFCALDYLKFGKDFIDKDIMVSTLKSIGEQGTKSVMFAGEGEPLLHKNIGLFTQTAKQAGMDVSITTNGIAFTKKNIEKCLPNLSWIRFSIDSGSPENYAKVHGTNQEDFGRLIRNIEETIKFRNENNLETIIGAQFLAISQNINEATKLARILNKIEIDNLQIKPYSHHPLKDKKGFNLDIEKYNGLEDDLMKYNSGKFKVLFRKATAKRIDEGINYPECYGLPFFTLIDSKGNIMPCNLFYKDEKFTYGNLYENSFSEVWKGEKRKKILEKININECRKGCRLDPINRYLDRLKNPQEHDNFI